MRYGPVGNAGGKRRNFEVEEWQKAQGNNTYFTRIHFGGNVVNLKPAAHWQGWISGG